jgi:hypothetical protein
VRSNDLGRVTRKEREEVSEAVLGIEDVEDQEDEVHDPERDTKTDVHAKETRVETRSTNETNDIKGELEEQNREVESGNIKPERDQLNHENNM